jgi:hypothetical protein
VSAILSQLPDHPANAGFSFIVVKAAAVVVDLRAVGEHTETTLATYAAMYLWNIASERRTRGGERIRYGTKDRVVEQTSSVCIRPSLASHRTGRHAALMPGKRAFPSHPSAMFPWRPSSIVVA